MKDVKQGTCEPVEVNKDVTTEEMLKELSNNKGEEE